MSIQKIFANHVIILYSVSIFLGAFLLFFVQPLIAKSVLPVLGGTPQVWNTCVLFFQIVLFIGYVYAHWLTSLRSTVIQIGIHALVVALPFVYLPFDLIASDTVNQNIYPALWLLGYLSITVGVPFFVVSTVSPLLQKWLAIQSHSESGDPYFLYASSNLGSMLGLIGFSFVIEPNFTISEQSIYWYGGYLVFFTLSVVIMGMLFRQGALVRQSGDKATRDDNEKSLDQAKNPQSGTQILRWLVLSFAPSSLMLGVTHYLSTDIAAVPLIWIVPLALYLLTYSMAFSRRVVIPLEVLGRVLGILLLVLVLFFISGVSRPISMIASLHIIVFFLVALLCHTKLAQSRPHTTNLTRFYMVIALGGLMGGVLNGLLSPVLFNDVWEYPIVLLLGTALAMSRREADSTDRQAVRVYALLPLIPAIVMGLLAGLWSWLRAGKHASDHLLMALQTPIVISIPIIMSYFFVKKPARYALALAGCMLIGMHLYTDRRGEVLLQERSYFGVHRVIEPRTEIDVTQLFHGQTLHGSQLKNNRSIATGYYHATGPAGQILRAVSHEGLKVGIVGLGAGTLAAYSLAGDHYTFFEIDPVVVNIAENGKYFSYLQDARERHANIRIETGDARLTIAKEADHGFDILILDAFSSDSVPVHLLTTEAMKMYASKVTSNGVLMFHVSNDYLDLISILARQAAETGFIAFAQNNKIQSKLEESEMKLASQWVAMLPRNSARIAQFRVMPQWQEVGAPNSLRAWSDSYSNLFQVVRW